MELLRNAFLNFCSENNIKPDKRLLSIIDSSSNVNGSLNLSECSLSLDMSKCLGLALTKDVHITHLDVSNSMLQEEGLSLLLRGLESNRTVISLKLVGNNIRSIGALSLAKFLRQNSHLQQMDLNWNALGILPDRFSNFCEGLIRNSALKELHLGHNQLNHECASALANVALKNTTLETLNLQFNSFGTIGGELLLQSFVKNRTLTAINIVGNNIGSVTESSIELAIQHNTSGKLMRRKHADEARALSNRLQETESEKNSQIKMLLESLEKNESETFSCQKLDASRIAELEKELSEKEMAYVTLNSKCRELETSLQSTESRVHDLSNLFNQLEMDKRRMKEKHCELLANEINSKNSLEIKLLEEINMHKEKVVHLAQKVAELEHKTNLQENSMRKSNSTVDKLENIFKEREINFSEKIDSLHQSHEKSLILAEDLRHKDVERLTNEYLQLEQRYMKRNQLLEQQKAALETEIDELKAKSEQELLLKEELHQQQKQKIKDDGKTISQKLSEVTTLLEKTMSEKRDAVQEYANKVQSLESKNTELQLQLEEQFYKITNLEQSVSGAEDKLKVEIAKVRLEYKDQLEDANNTKVQNEHLCQKMDELNNQLEDLKVSHSEKLEIRDREIKEAKHEVNLQKQRLLLRIADEEKRADLLRLTIETYLDDVKRAGEGS